MEKDDRPVKRHAYIRLKFSPNYVPKDSLISKIIDTIGARSFILSVILILIISLIYIRLNFNYIGLYVDSLMIGLISSAITIFVFDYFTNYDRRRRLQQINLESNDALLTHVRMIIRNILYVFDPINYDEKNKNSKDSDLQLEFYKLYKNKNYIKDIFLNFQEYSKAGLEFFVVLGIIVFYDTNDLKKFYYKLFPYQDPKLTYKLEYDITKYTSKFIGVYIPLITAFPNKSKSKYRYDPEFDKSKSWVDNPRKTYEEVTSAFIYSDIEKTIKDFVNFCKILDEIATKSKNRSIAVDL